MLAPLLAAACYESTTDLSNAPVYRAYAADFVYNCPVPFSYEAGGALHVYEGAELVLRVGDRVELAFYSRVLSGADDPVNWSADTLRVAGTYERDGFTLRFRFDEGYERTMPMEAELQGENRLSAGFADGGSIEFVPLEQRPSGPPEPCQP